MFILLLKSCLFDAHVYILIHVLKWLRIKQNFKQDLKWKGWPICIKSRYQNPITHRCRLILVSQPNRTNASLSLKHYLIKAYSSQTKHMLKNWRCYLPVSFCVRMYFVPLHLCICFIKQNCYLKLKAPQGYYHITCRLVITTVSARFLSTTFAGKNRMK